MMDPILWSWLEAMRMMWWVLCQILLLGSQSFFLFVSYDIYTNCVSRMMVMNSLTLVRGAEIFLATKGQPSSHVIKHLLT